VDRRAVTDDDVVGTSSEDFRADSRLKPDTDDDTRADYPPSRFALRTDPP
jgi:hypothetical protein